MKKIYLIYCETTWIDNDTTKSLLWATESEKEARKDCRLMQIEFNEDHSRI